MVIGFSQMRIDQAEAQMDKYCFPLTTVSVLLFDQNHPYQRLLVCRLVALSAIFSTGTVLFFPFPSIVVPSSAYPYTYPYCKCLDQVSEVANLHAELSGSDTKGTKCNDRSGSEVVVFAQALTNTMP